jgi:hypothetical protein
VESPKARPSMGVPMLCTVLALAGINFGLALLVV